VLLAAVASAALLGGLTGCGVQTTGVHISSPGPVTLDGAVPSSPAADAGSGQYSYYLFLWHGKSVGSVTPVLRTTDHDLSPAELVDELGSINEDESADGYTTQVPYRLGQQLLQTKEKHSYQSMEPLTTAALTQVVCTLDLYWVQHPDPDRTIRPSTKISGAGITYPIWDDCIMQPGFSQALAVLNLQTDAPLSGLDPAPTAASEARAPAPPAG
jgi:hypothetical protein